MTAWKRTMSTTILLLLATISNKVHADITKTPSSGVFLEGSDVTLTCVVEGNENVIWEDFSDATSIFVGKEKNTVKKKYDNFEISSVDGDFSLIIKDVHSSDEGTYICKDRDRLANATVSIGVLPYVYLSVKQSEATQASQTSTEVNITCSAYNARPAVSVFELSVIGSEKTVIITDDKSNLNEDGNTYNSSASLPYIMSSEEMSVCCRIFRDGLSLNHIENFNLPRCNIAITGQEVRCACQGYPPVDTYCMDFNGHIHEGVLDIKKSNLANITCFGRNGIGTGRSDLLLPGDKTTLTIAAIFVTTALVLTVIVVAVIYIIHRIGSRKKESCAPVKWRKREKNENTTKHQINIQNNDVLETDELNYYSAADVKEGRSPVIVDEKDISIINSMKMGNIYNRWLGTVNLPSRSNTCVVITSITEIVRRTDNIHWEAFLRKCLQLPESKNLTNIEAISIQSNNLYLVSEHLVCETLHCLLTRETVEKRNVYCCSSLPDVIKHVTGLLEGMHIINTYGFLHPGLTTRKLLVTTDGQLKLYDFCLDGDAPSIAALKRSTMISATLNQFSPETLISSEYTESSDVWSLAVTIWEIMSNGKSPFPGDTEITSHKELFEPSLPWPEKCIQIKNTLLYKCWSNNCSCRPSIHRLKGTFMEIFQKLLDDSSYEIPMSTTYVAMGSANIAEDTYS
ncbi:uncharacterized protein [Apostichopus japonicus]|uniref:uncharacterized protein isoform X2 n=1 Tax=Stichopus japonicus TaxID=307972 RepID=UPI003AB1B9B2